MFTSEHVSDLVCQATRCSQQRNLLQVSRLFEYFTVPVRPHVSAETLTFFFFFLSSLSCPLDFLAGFTLIKKSRVHVTECTMSAECFELRVFSFPDEQRSSVNESSSLLGGSPHRHCRRKSSPYHTGQLHPAVRVADLLQHINQMKTAEGYGFKQEYEVRKERGVGSQIYNSGADVYFFDSSFSLRLGPYFQLREILIRLTILYDTPNKSVKTWISLDLPAQSCASCCVICCSNVAYFKSSAGVLV